MEEECHEYFGILLTKISDNEGLYLTSSKNLIKYTKRWKFNRPPDEKRVKDIVKIINDTNHVEGIIYIAEVFAKNKSINYVCYDGNHRREALEDINKNINVLVNLKRKCSREELKKKFIILNSGNPVPELYIDNNKSDIGALKLNIEELVKKICSEFTKYQSTSRNPIKPNFNRDNLTDILYKYFTNNKIYNINLENIFKQILELNKNYSKGEKINLSDTKKYSKHMIERAEKNGCYLFLKDFIEDLEI